VSNMPLAQIEAYQARMGWTMPFVSSDGTAFADDCGARGGVMLSVFLRDGEDVYRTYGTTARGVDRLLFVNNILDLARMDARRTGKIPRLAGRSILRTGR
jgi:predicted dithiol-disulfide oxidoreductase (DUF899 family)